MLWHATRQKSVVCFAVMMDDNRVVIQLTSCCEFLRQAVIGAVPLALSC